MSNLPPIYDIENRAILAVFYFILMVGLVATFGIVIAAPDFAWFVFLVTFFWLSITQLMDEHKTMKARRMFDE